MNCNNGVNWMELIHDTVHGEFGGWGGLHKSGYFRDHFGDSEVLAWSSLLISSPKPFDDCLHAPTSSFSNSAFCRESVFLGFVSFSQ